MNLEFALLFFACVCLWVWVAVTLWRRGEGECQFQPSTEVRTVTVSPSVIFPPGEPLVYSDVPEDFGIFGSVMASRAREVGGQVVFRNGQRLRTTWQRSGKRVLVRDASGCERVYELDGRRKAGADTPWDIVSVK